MRYSLSLLGATVLFSLGALASDATAGDLRVLHHFGYGTGGGVYPDTDLVADAQGDLFGMTVLGGSFNSGAVIRLSNSFGVWTEEVLYSFTSGADGGQPYGGVTLDDAGNIYGTAVVGGSWAGCPEDGCGVAWRLTPDGFGAYTYDVIHAFNGGLADGQGPGAPMTLDAQGNLYGMTAIGGEFGLGVVYQLKPTASGPWTETIIHHFTGGLDGSSGSKARFLVDTDGSLLSVTTTGGAFGVGTVFRLSPTASGPWNHTTLYSFQGDPDGVFPYGSLVRDAAGSLYGTTYYGGSNGIGTVYKLTDVGGGVWAETVLHDFKGGSDGAYPISALVFGNNGALYGTSSQGGLTGDNGTVFKLWQTAAGTWRTSVVHAFDGADGEQPYNGLVKDPAGNLYGAAVHGGDNDDGTIFKFAP